MTRFRESSLIEYLGSVLGVSFQVFADHPQVPGPGPVSVGGNDKTELCLQGARGDGQCS